MAQSIFLPPTQLGSYPNSPDPTPLRLLAFSVAEAALQPDPNSPSFGFNVNMAPLPNDIDVAVATGKLVELNKKSSRWATAFDPTKVVEPKPTIASRRGKPLWDVVERAKERRERERSSPGSVDSPLPQSPFSPPSYNFTVPVNSALASSVSNLNLDSPSFESKVPGLSLSPTPDRHRYPLFTRSAEPSPTQSVFSGLDRTRPPPEFVPRLSAQDFSQKSEQIASAAVKGHARTKSQSLGGSPSEGLESDLISPSQRLRAQSRLNMPSKFAARNKLPSLAELQAKLSKVQAERSSPNQSHRRVGSLDEVDLTLPTPPRMGPLRFESDYSIDLTVEEIQTPTEEFKRNPYIVSSSAGSNSDGINTRPATPPSPSPLGLNGKESKEPRLAPFLRQRTSGRLIASNKVSQSPERMTSTLRESGNGMPQPVFRIIPPTLEAQRSASDLQLNLNSSQSKYRSEQLDSPTTAKQGVPFPRTPARSLTMPSPSPTKQVFNLLGTPPSNNSALNLIRARTSSSPSFSPCRTQTSSPTGSYRSSSASPTLSLSVPIITCTPAPADGSDSESDCDSEGDVIVFDSEAEEMKEREERERRGREMMGLLGARRRLSE